MLAVNPDGNKSFVKSFFGAHLLGSQDQDEIHPAQN